MTTNEMLAYIGGLLDGEGCFTIVDNSPSRHPQAVVSVCNTDENVLLIVQAFLSASDIVSNITERKREDPKHRTLYYLRIVRRDSLLRLCKLVMPYLLIKGRQCQLLMSFVRLRLSVSQQNDIYINEELTLMTAIQAINQGAAINVKSIDYSDATQDLELGALG